MSSSNVMYGSPGCMCKLSCLRLQCYIYEGALQYTMLIFRFPGLHMLRQYNIDKDVTNIYMTLYYNYIFLLLQHHIIYINTHLSGYLPIFLKYIKFIPF